MEVNITTEIVTIGEARRRLPLVRSLVRQIMTIFTEANAHRLDLEPAPHGTGDGSDVQLAYAKKRLDELRVEFQDALNELNELGGVLEDAEAGAINFYGWKDDDIVHFCWKHGEKDIDHWHRIEEGYAERRRIEKDQEETGG